MDNKDLKGQSGNADQGRKAPDKDSDTPKGKLEELLASWEPKGTDGGKKPKESDVTKRLEQLEAAVTRTSYESDMKSIVAQVKGELEVDDWIVEAWINKRADSDPKLVKLWEERDTEKAQFQKVIQSLGPEFQEYAKGKILPKVEPKNEEVKDKEDKKGSDKGLAAAVRNSRDASPSSGYDDTKWASLGESDFALKKAEVFRLARAGKLK